MKKDKVLVCGATGFIGRNTAEFLAAQGYEVYGTYHRHEPWAHERVTWHQADLTAKKDVARVVESMDIVIQAAATTSGARDICANPAYHVTDNAVMNALLFRAALDAGVKHLVFYSCTTMYPSSDTPLKETDFDANAEFYPGYFGGAWTKVYNEKMCEFYSRFGQTRFTVIRHSNIYGPYDKFDLERSHVFGATVTKVETCPPGGSIVVWGDGSQGRDLLYVGDLMEFVGMALERQEEAFGLYNVGCGHAVTVNELVRTIIDVSGRDVRIEHDLSQPTVQTSLCLDCSKAREQLGWQARTSLQEGIRRTLEWVRTRHPDYVKCEG